jgi:hypothetical protein
MQQIVDDVIESHGVGVSLFCGDAKEVIFLQEGQRSTLSRYRKVAMNDKEYQLRFIQVFGRSYSQHTHNNAKTAKSNVMTTTNPFDWVGYKLKT